MVKSKYSNVRKVYRVSCLLYDITYWFDNFNEAQICYNKMQVLYGSAYVEFKTLTDYDFRK